MTKRRVALGSKAERICRRRLRLSGWKILETNWRTSFGEIDLIAIERRTLVFIEVKSSGPCLPCGEGRERPGPERPVLAVGPDKQVRLRRLADAWFAQAEHEGRLSRRTDSVRFDVIGVVFGESGRITDWEHLRDAF